MDISDSYYYCKESGITSTMLFGEVPLTPQISIKNGLVLELLIIKKHDGLVTWCDFKQWLQALSGSHDSVSIAAVQKSVSNLLSKKAKNAKEKRHQTSS